MRRAPPLSSLFCHYYLHAVYKRAVTLPADNTQKATSADELSIQWSPHNTSIGGADLREKRDGESKRGCEGKKDGKKAPEHPSDRQEETVCSEYEANLQPRPPRNMTSCTPDSVPAAAVSYLTASSSAS